MLAKLCDLRQVREEAYSATTQSLAQETRSAGEAFIAIRDHGKVWNTRTFQFSKIALDDAHNAVKAQESVLLALMERSGVHLALKGPHAYVCPSAKCVSCPFAAHLFVPWRTCVSVLPARCLLATSAGSLTVGMCVNDRDA